MKINLIWVCESGSIDDSPYIVEAWDEFTIGENEDGWADAVKEANKKYGAENVRIMAVSIPSAAVRKLWDVPVVTAKVGR